MATKSILGLSITNTVTTESDATTVSFCSDHGAPSSTSFIVFNSGFASANANEIENSCKILYLLEEQKWLILVIKGYMLKRMYTNIGNILKVFRN